MDAIIQRKNGDFEHYRENHPRCFCHILALILGAGLKSLELKNLIQAPTSTTKPNYFPALEMIVEVKEDEEESTVDDEIQEIMESDDGEEIDPDDASDGCISEEEQESTPKETNTANETNGKNTKRGYVEGGIGHTLAKVEYICCRVCSSTAKRAEFQLIAKNLPYTGPQLIAGYGIRWNVAYDSWQRAYSAKKVITQLLTDESDKYAGKSAAGHFFKGYKVSNKEWEDVNSLNKVLAYFLATTLRMEGDGTTSLMVLYEYYRLINFLETKKKSPECVVLIPMFDPMINIAKKLSLIKDKFPEYSDIAKALLDEAFKAKSEAHLKMNPTTTTSQSNDVESEDDEFNYYPEKTGPSQDADELRKYKEGVWPLSKKSDPLVWWRVKFPRLAMVARDVLACAGSSASVERTFSAAADVCVPGRSSLAATTIERCVSSHMWLQKGIKAGAEFADAQAVIDAAKLTKKFSSQINIANRKTKCHKIKHAASKNDQTPTSLESA
ncbi:hypothetical protein Pst134EA_009792 [Puccinia striiformis f. sp. tritici]|uniref:hypothetical protein n=1 Tax=Puccinia striiformis f. sp. tritici TaxID=168172 RepID=UPI0020079AD6|nr:hypothetical protein Pst134EA_009792 [Puccinia striiformis f. sp. tritici]KAH9469271.1 hypothetical protein Pst134EA_009792 [Puccinia striiformis f. sp. tritici]